MPLYTIQHSVSLSFSQQEGIAQVITAAHCRRFGVPRLFVNVSFQDISKDIEFVGGKPAHPNRIIAGIRPNAPGAGRNDESIEELLREIENGWNDIVGRKGEKALGVLVAEPVLQVVIEKGVLVPKAGFDFDWIRENLEDFKARAASGETEFASLVEELEERSK